MYVAVKGGEKAINAAHEWLADQRRGDVGVDELCLLYTSDAAANREV